MFNHLFEVLQQTEFWVDHKKRIAKTENMNSVEAQNAFNFVKRNSREYRDSCLRSYHTMYPADNPPPPGILKEYNFIKHMDSVEFVIRQPLMVRLHSIANNRKAN